MLDSGQTTISHPEGHELASVLYHGDGFSSGPHTLEISFNTNQTSYDVIVDYALVKPTLDAQLSGQQFYVPYNDSSIVYSGNWKVSQDGTLKESVTAGDEMSFPFYGTQ